ncbi:hypothetical protein B7494_g2191 [Chlorociboria aeruginascens]|nr:hypothetical protein B7494_g2191 [Chlorociboria aeruginascens]
MTSLDRARSSNAKKASNNSELIDGLALGYVETINELLYIPHLRPAMLVVICQENMLSEKFTDSFGKWITKLDSKLLKSILKPKAALKRREAEGYFGSQELLDSAPHEEGGSLMFEVEEGEPRYTAAEKEKWRTQSTPPQSLVVSTPSTRSSIDTGGFQMLPPGDNFWRLVNASPQNPGPSRARDVPMSSGERFPRELLLKLYLNEAVGNIESSSDSDSGEKKQMIQLVCEKHIPSNAEEDTSSISERHIGAFVNQLLPLQQISRPLKGLTGEILNLKTTEAPGVIQGSACKPLGSR